MLPIQKRYAIELLDRSAKLLSGGDLPMRALAAEITGAIKFSMYAIAAREARANKLPRSLVPPTPEENTRYGQLLSRVAEGIALTDVAREFGISRQRVHQIMAMFGVKRPESYRRTKTAELLKERAEGVNARCLARWGVDHQTAKTLRDAGTLPAFRMQRNAAHAHAIAWTLTFKEWLDAWIASGMLEKRGRGKGKYVMVPDDKALGYCVGNVKIIGYEDNIRDVRRRTLGNVATRTGVYLMYPGLGKPYVARVKGRQIGMFATAQEAQAARDAFLAQPPMLRSVQARAAALAPP